MAIFMLPRAARTSWPFAWASSRRTLLEAGDGGWGRSISQQLKELFRDSDDTAGRRCTGNARAKLYRHLCSCEHVFTHRFILLICFVYIYIYMQTLTV